MVRVVLSGRWSAAEREILCKIISETLMETLRLSASAAFFQLKENLPGAAREISVIVQLFPAGNGRMRRVASDEMVRRLAEGLHMMPERVRVRIAAPPQERGQTE